MSADLITFALVTTGIATGHLLAGLATGWFMRRRVRASRARKTVTVKPESSRARILAPVISSVENLRTDMRALEQLCREPDKVPSKDLADLLAKLVWALDQLHQSLSQASKPTAAASASATSDTTSLADSNVVEKSHRMGTHAVGNSRILEWFNAKSLGQVALQDRRRFPFAVQQLAAPRRGDELPPAASFELVQCHDISPSELRYVAENRPKENAVVVGLGMPKPIKFMLAEVVDYRSVYMYGRVGYLVTVKFVSPVDHPDYLEQLTAGIPDPTAAGVT